MEDTEARGGDRDWLTPRGARGIVALLVCVKLAATVWDCVTFDAQPYDAPKHLRRAAAGGLEIGALSYDPPLYYLPASGFAAVKSERWRPGQRAARREQQQQAGQRRQHGLTSPLLDFLRYTNIVYLGAFYLLWIYGVLPRVLPDWRCRTLAAMLLLALPGYQKLGVMPHPDNLHVALAALCTFVWVRMPGVGATPESSPTAPTARSNLALALVSGLSGLTRPFAAATVATFAAANVAHLWLRRNGSAAAFVRRASLVLLLTGVIAGSWFAARGLAGGTWREAYPKGYIEQFDRRGFDYGHYLTTFYFGELLLVPNRQIARLDSDHWEKKGYVATNRYANSFFTTLYSETWGDHWLYFSGPNGHDLKVMVKRVIFVVALPLVPLLLLRFGSTAVALARNARQQGVAVALDPAAALFVHFVAGATLFLWWQLGSSLSPGKQSSIKFIYSAYLFAPAVTLCFTTAIAPRRANAWVAYLLVLFMAALPMAVFVPRSW